MTLIDTKSVAIFAHNFNTDDNSNNNITLSPFEHTRNIENILKYIERDIH